MAFLKMGDDLTSVAQLKADLARTREEKAEAWDIVKKVATVMDFRAGANYVEEAARLAKLVGRNETLRGTVASLREENRELDAALTAANLRVAELEHSLSDAMDLIEGIQGTNAVHMARVAELESEVRELRDVKSPFPPIETQAILDANLRVAALKTDRDKWRSRARRLAPTLYPTPGGGK